jgi:hypothetical protein
MKMRYLIVLACLLIAAAEALATEVTFPGAVAEGYPKIERWRATWCFLQGRRLRGRSQRW